MSEALKIAQINAICVAAQIEKEAMTVENQERLAQDKSIAYTATHFFGLAEKLLSDVQKVMENK